MVDPEGFRDGGGGYWVSSRVRYQRTEHYSVSYCYENVPGSALANTIIQFGTDIFIQTAKLGY